MRGVVTRDGAVQIGGALACGGVDGGGAAALLVGTTLIEVTLSRHRLMHPGSFVGVDVLRFSTEEIRRLMLSLPGGLDATAVREETGGWPIAVRLVLVGGALPSTAGSTASSFLSEYVREHVLAALPPGLADFVLDGTVCAELTPETAAVVTASGVDIGSGRRRRSVRKT